jgi:Zn-dependent protease with chaperone function
MLGCMCMHCYETAAGPLESSSGVGRRGFLTALVASAASVAPSAFAQVAVGEASRLRGLVPADRIEAAATQQYSQLLQEARQKNALAPPGNPQFERLRAISTRLIAHAAQWNDRARAWQWEVNLIGSKQVNAFCMPGGKIAVFTGLLNGLKLTDDETAMVVGHEMAHALREHARARIGKSQTTGAALSIGASILGLGHVGDIAANLGTQLLTLRFSRNDEIDADLVGLELAARAGFNPEASLSLWQKMGTVQGKGGPAFLSTHPTGPDRQQRLRENIPRVRGLYQQAVAGR